MLLVEPQRATSSFVKMDKIGFPHSFGKLFSWKVEVLLCLIFSFSEDKRHDYFEYDKIV